MFHVKHFYLQHYISISFYTAIFLLLTILYVIMFHVKHTQKTQVNYQQLLDLLFNESQLYNLTGLKNKEDMQLKHIEDSLILSGYIQGRFSQTSTILDLGTGAGFPGLIVALENPDIKLCLIDSTAKKINFVNKVIDLYNIKNATAVCDRVENFALKSSYAFDILIARSLARLDILLEYAAPLLKTNGHLLAMKSEQLEDELCIAAIVQDKLGFVLNQTYEYSLALQKRYILDFQKLKESTIKLPRSNGLASSKPLSGRK